jgi:5S rRNA maturation endonuclease (ribonuclease M5)
MQVFKVKTKKRPSQLAKALIETAAAMHRVGVLTDADFQRITVRHLQRGSRRDS